MTQRPWLKNSVYPPLRAGPSHLGIALAPDCCMVMRECQRYDAVIVNGIWQYHSFAVCVHLAGTQTPYFVFVHGMLGPWFKHQYRLST